MAESSFIWDAAGGGDQSPHSEADVAAMFAAMAGGNGVFRAYLNDLAPTVSGSNVLVNTGWAMVDGHPYRNSSSKSTTITTPSSGTTGHRIVLRASWSAQTVRITDIASADGTAAIPAATTTSGTTYDVTLATLTITTGGVITLTDAREFAPKNSTDVQVFTASGTWTKPTGVGANSTVEVWAMGGGGGGGGGRGDSAGTTRNGGAGGGGGGFVRKTFRASDLSATETVTIAATAAGGAGGSSADGSDGTIGNNTTFGSFVTSYGGRYGQKGNNFSTSAGGDGGGWIEGSSGLGAPVSGGMPGQGGAGSWPAEWGGGGGGNAPGNDNGSAGGSSLMGAGGGGGGGACPATNIEKTGGAGGSTSSATSGGGGTGGTTNGGAGGNGAASSLTFAGGSGGGGGGAQDSGTGGAGGNGARGGGGGGGAGGTTTGGAGGDGGAGYCVVVTYI